jgi:hypothetical protein
VSKYYDDPMPLLFADFQATAHQGRADALVLAFRQDGHRSKRQGRNNPGLRDDGQVAEQDVADDLLIFLGDQRSFDVPAAPKGIHKTGLGVLAEGQQVHLSNGLVIGASFRSDQEIHGCPSSAHSGNCFQALDHPHRVRQVWQYARGSLFRQPSGLVASDQAKETNPHRLRCPHVPNTIANVNNFLEGIMAVVLSGSLDGRPQYLRSVIGIIGACV